MVASKIKNVTGSDIVIGSTTISDGVLTDLSSLSISTDGELKGKLFYHLENNDIELYDENSAIINTSYSETFKRVDDRGNSISDKTESTRNDLIKLNEYVNQE